LAVGRLIDNEISESTKRGPGGPSQPNCPHWLDANLKNKLGRCLAEGIDEYRPDELDERDHSGLDTREILDFPRISRDAQNDWWR